MSVQGRAECHITKWSHSIQNSLITDIQSCNHYTQHFTR